MELLAPAGNLENFQVALAAGADAVYVGVPGFNARNLARDLRLEEIGAMIRHCRERGKKLYVAANSLILERELPAVIETLAALERLQPDALIVQDLGVIRLVRTHFPALQLHASTLMTAHNADAVRMLAAMGCKRVVLARELTVKEIAGIAAGTATELEVFVQGAMCFSYSGLCLFSSYLGGKSGLRGRCVQPCRRAYRWQGKAGKGGGRKGAGAYLFSMNDLCGLAAVPELRRIGIAALKIEGRLRSAHYVSHVVQAYRGVLDAGEDDLARALQQAERLIDRAMGRSVSPGFFFSPQPKEAVSPQHSGNIGLHLGRMKTLRRQQEKTLGTVTLNNPLEIGDRLRLHWEASGERSAFTLKELRIGSRPVDRAEAGETVSIEVPNGGRDAGRVELYKSDVRSRPVDISALNAVIETVRRELVRDRGRLRKRIASVWDTLRSPESRQEKDGPHEREQGRKAGREKKGSSLGIPLEWWLKTDSPRLALERLPFSPDRLLVTLDKTMLGLAGRIRQHPGLAARNVIWALPPVLVGAELGRMKANVIALIRSGFKSFQLGHLSQLALFGSERVHLFGDYTLNLANAQAARQAADAGLEAAQAAIELDRAGLAELLQGCRNGSMPTQTGAPSWPRIRLGLTVYGAPALFTARLAAPHFQYDRVLESPKGELFTIRKMEGGTRTVPCRPFSLLPYLHELKEMGVHYVVVDACGLGNDKKGLQELAERLTGKGRAALPTFNYRGRLE